MSITNTRVGLVEGAREFVHQVQRARVAVRLEQHVDAAGSRTARAPSRVARISVGWWP